MNPRSSSPRTPWIAFGVGVVCTGAGFLALGWLSSGEAGAGSAPSPLPRRSVDPRFPPAPMHVDVDRPPEATVVAQRTVMEPAGPSEQDELARARDTIARLEAEIARLQALLDQKDELRPLYHEYLEEQGFRHADVYAALLDFLRDPERLPENHEAALGWIETLLSREPLVAMDREVSGDDYRTWHQELEPQREQSNELQVEWSLDTYLFGRGDEEESVASERIQYRIELPDLPSPDGWQNRAIEDAAVVIEVSRFEDGNWSAKLLLECDGEGAEVDVEYYPASGYALELEPVRGGEVYRENLALNEELVRLLRPFQDFFHRHAPTLRR